MESEIVYKEPIFYFQIRVNSEVLRVRIPIYEFWEGTINPIT